MKYSPEKVKMAELFAYAKMAFGLKNPGILRQYVRLEPLATIRAVVLAYAHHSEGLTTAQIDMGLEGDRSNETIRRRIQEHEGRLECDRSYREHWEILCNYIDKECLAYDC